MADPANKDQSGTLRAIPFPIWIYARLVIPTAPIAIQYGLYGLGLYVPPFPQPTYIILLFSLTLGTIVEYQKIASQIYFSIIPSIVAAVLYVTFIMVSNDPSRFEPNRQTRILFVGFYLWLFFLTVNVMRVLVDGILSFLNRPK